MGRPIAKKFLGTGATEGDIRVRFKTGGTEYNGYIVSQRGTKKFNVTDGNVTAICTLTNKNDTGLSDGDMTIKGSTDAGVAGFVSKIAGRKCTLVDSTGAVLTTGPWNFAASGSDGFIQFEESGGMAADAIRGNGTVITGNVDLGSVT